MLTCRRDTLLLRQVQDQVPCAQPCVVCRYDMRSSTARRLLVECILLHCHSPSDQKGAAEKQAKKKRGRKL